MGVFDNVATPGAPNIAGAGNMAAQLYQMIGGLGQDYVQGQQNARTLRLQNLFKDGLPKDADGNIDVGAASDALIKAGGADEARTYIPFLYDLRNQNEFYKRFNSPPDASQQPEQGTQGPNISPGPHDGQAPGPLQRAAANQPGQPQPPQQSQTTMRKLLGDDSMDPAVMERYARAAGARAGNGMMAADQPLSPTQADYARKIIGSHVIPNGQSGGSNEITPNGTGGPRTPSQGETSSAVSPSPQQSMGSGYRPSPLGTAAEADRHDAVAAYYDRLGAQPRISPQQAAMAKQESERHAGIAKQIRESLSTYNAPTPDERNAAASGMTPLQFNQQKTLNEKDVEAGSKRYENIAKAGDAALDLAPQIRLARSLVNSQGFNAGIGVQFTDTLRRLSSTLGGDPNAAAPGQVFDKIRAGSILNNIKEMSAAGTGPVRVAEMKFIDTLQASREVDPPAIRAVIEAEGRLTDRMQQIYTMAQDYRHDHGFLDAGFDRQVSNYKTSHPLFSDAELANPKLLTLPVFNSPAEMRGSRMPSGTRFRNQHGDLGTIP